jgi:two-component system sensor histidine kinase YesM
VKKPRSLKNKLFLYVILVAIVPSIAITLYYYADQRRMHDEIVIDNTAAGLVYILHNVEEQLANAEQLSDWTFTSRTLQKLLLTRAAAQDIAYTQSLMSFQESIDDLLMSSSIGKYVSTMLIIGTHGADIRAGMDAALIDKDALMEEPWFQELMNRSEKSARGSVVPNPTGLRNDQYVIPFAKPLVDMRSFAKVGWIFMGFRLSLVADSFKNYLHEQDTDLFLADSSGFIAYHSDPSLVGKSIGEVYPFLSNPGPPEGLEILKDRYPIFVLYRAGSSGWLIGQEVSGLALGSRTRTLLVIGLLILFGSLAFTAILAVFLSTRLTRPLRRILGKMKDISSGDFGRDPFIEGEDELGLLGHGINAMAEDIRQLLDRLLAEESQKRRLELAMLQYQINPHFLYNTLNTLRWIAILQKADGLRDAITALGRLLRNALGDTDQQIAIREELALLQDYVLIQKLRYKERFDVEYRIDSELTLDCMVPKLTLQPLVENAIFHGIERKKNAGLVTISVRACEEGTEIVVEDDGVGMTEREIQAVLSAERGGSDGRGFSGIGIRNVEERIQLMYGKRFGISIESVEERFTRVIVKLPGPERKVYDAQRHNSG